MPVQPRCAFPLANSKHMTAPNTPLLSWVRDEVRALSAYHVPPATGLIKLDAMENPYRLPAEVAAEVGALAASAEVNRYPDAAAEPLKAALRESMEVPEGAALVLGNGSDELIQLLAMALARPGAVLLAPEPGFVMYRMIATFCGLRYVGVPLRDDFSLDMPAMLAATAEHRPALTFLAYPNNPTGNLFAREAVDMLLEAAEGWVVVDEAYAPFASDSYLPRLAAHRNLLVMRTLSKLGLAGLRLGVLAGDPIMVGELDKLRLPYNINTMTQAVATRLLTHHGDIFAAQAAAIRAERVRLLGALRARQDVVTYASEANFLLLRVAEAARVFAALRDEHGVLIKCLDGAHPMLSGCLRVTVGTAQENDRFLEALDHTL